MSEDKTESGPHRREVNLTPALEDEFKRRTDNFRRLMEDVTPEDFQKALDKTEEEIETTHDEDHKHQLFEIKEGIIAAKDLRDQMKAGMNVEPFIERLARTSVVQLAHSEESITVEHSGPRGDVVSTMMLQVSRAAYALAQSRFPEELKKQEATEAKRTQHIVDASKEKISKFRIS